FKPARWPGIAETGCLIQSGESAYGGGLIEAVCQNLVEEPLQFVRAARPANQLDPRAPAVTRKGLFLKELAEHHAGFPGVDRLQPELQLFLVTFDFPFAGFNGGNPGIREVVDGEPEGVIEKRVRRLVENRQGEFGGFGGRNLRERAQGFETNP